jgi:hypothetical protein
MEDLKDNEKTIAILKHQLGIALKENDGLKTDNSLLESEIVKLRDAFDLKDDEKYTKFLFGVGF